MYPIFKRLLDRFFSIIFLVIFSPLFLVLAIWIKLDSKGPIIFRQDRLGKDKKVFTIYKFRTMESSAPKETPTQELDDPLRYITKSGCLLRQTSLDELPQLFNIFKGEMSFVGPRPILIGEKNLIAERDMYDVYKLYPGITGWAQINGRDELTDEKKAKFDGEYAQKISPVFDAKIIILTIFKVLKRDGFKEGSR